MRKENFKAGFSVIYLILCLNGIQKKLEFYKCAIFFLDKDNFSDPPEIRKDIVNTIVVILHREWANKKNLRWAVFQHKLFWIRIHYRLRFPSIDFSSFLPNPKLFTL